MKETRFCRTYVGIFICACVSYALPPSCHLEFHRPPYSEQYSYRLSLIYLDHVRFGIRYSTTYIGMSILFFLSSVEKINVLHAYNAGRVCVSLSSTICLANHLLRPNWHTLVRIVVITGPNAVETYLVHSIVTNTYILSQSSSYLQAKARVLHTYDAGCIPISHSPSASLSTRLS